jgi:hypothetical protein
MEWRNSRPARIGSTLSGKGKQLQHPCDLISQNVPDLWICMPFAPELLLPISLWQCTSLNYGKLFMGDLNVVEIFARGTWSAGSIGVAVF